MLIRLYFLLPDADLARNIVNELSDHNVLPSHIHAHCRNASMLSRMPRASNWQRLDVLRKIEQIVWRTDLLIFMAALAAFITTLITGAYLWSLVSMVVMSIAFFAGNYFASHVPNVHLNEFADALAHNEVLLMVDVEQENVAKIESLVERHHPAAVAGGSSWTLDLIGI